MHYFFPMRILRGLSISSGCAAGEAVVLCHDRKRPEHEMWKTSDEAEAEEGKFYSACHAVVEEINELIGKTVDKEGIAVLESQVLMAKDPEFISLVLKRIKEDRYKAPWAVEAAAEEVIKTLNSLASEVFRERCLDIQEVAAKIISVLASSPSAELNLDHPVILIADTLLPFEFLSLTRENILALCLEAGGTTSHVAILARSFGIPCLMAVKDACEAADDGVIVALDAFEGYLCLEPDEEILNLVLKKREEKAALATALEEEAFLPAVTRDGRKIKLECNIEGAEAVGASLSAGAEGIGLFRSEFLLMGAKEGEDVYETSKKAYSSVASAYEGRGDVTIRTYDVGGDKVLGANEDDNPALGWRAVRFCMDRKDLFRSQLKAILESSLGGNLRILFPMISGPKELDSVLAFFEEVKQECREEGIAFDESIKVGIMIEVPSAAISADLLARKVDFFSVGTNDLIQYTLAVDRNNAKVGYLYDQFHPSILRLLKRTVEVANKEGIEVAMCGEMAGDLLALPMLIGLGFDTLSMNASSLLEARKVIRSVSYSDCVLLAKKALNMTSCSDIRHLAEKFDAEISAV